MPQKSIKHKCNNRGMKKRALGSFFWLNLIVWFDNWDSKICAESEA